MLMPPPSVKIFLSRAPTDMRKSFDGLSALAREVIRQDPLSGHLFVFRSRTGDRLKILYWDRSGYCLWYKRLEEGTFALPEGDAEGVELDPADLAMMLEGIDAAGVRRGKRFTLRPAAGATA